MAGITELFLLTLWRVWDDYAPVPSTLSPLYRSPLSPRECSQQILDSWVKVSVLDEVLTYFKNLKSKILKYFTMPFSKTLKILFKSLMFGIMFVNFANFFLFSQWEKRTKRRKKIVSSLHPFSLFNGFKKYQLVKKFEKRHWRKENFRTLKNNSGWASAHFLLLWWND